MADEPLRIYGPYPHGDVWRLHIVRGRGRRRSTVYRSFDTRELAEAFASGAREKATGITIAKAVRAYLDHLRENQRAAATIESAEDRLSLLLGLPANNSRPLRWLAHRGAELYAAARKGRASDTHINALLVGKTWGTFLVKRRMMRSSPFANVDPVGRKKHGEDQPRLTTDEARRLLVYCQRHSDDPGAVLTMGYLLLGSRASELVKRTVRDLDDDGRQLVIGRTKTRKGTRRVELPPELRELLIGLAEGKEPGDLLFGGWSRFVARAHVKRVCKAAGVPELPPQALRRTQATLATEAGVAALAVAAHLGHAGTAITQRAYVDPSATRSARGRAALKVLKGDRR